MAARTPFSTAGMKLRGMAPPTILFDELEALAARLRARPPSFGELAAAAGLLLVLALGLGGALDGLR